PRVDTVPERIEQPSAQQDAAEAAVDDPYLPSELTVGRRGRWLVGESVRLEHQPESLLDDRGGNGEIVRHVRARRLTVQSAPDGVDCPVARHDAAGQALETLQPLVVGPVQGLAVGTTVRPSLAHVDLIAAHPTDLRVG